MVRSAVRFGKNGGIGGAEGGKSVGSDVDGY